MTVQSLEANHFVHSSRIVSFLYPAFCFLFFPLFYPGCFVNLVLPAALYSYLNQSHTQDSAHSGSTSFSSCPSGASTVCSIHIPYNPSLAHLVYLSPCASLSTLVIMLYLVVSRLTFTLHAAFIRSTSSLAASPSRLHYNHTTASRPPHCRRRYASWLDPPSAHTHTRTQHGTRTHRTFSSLHRPTPHSFDIRTRSTFTLPCRSPQYVHPLP